MTRKCVCVCSSESDGAKQDNECEAEAESCCAFLSGLHIHFIAHSRALCSGGVSASMMTIANLFKDMDYIGAQLASKRSIIHIRFSA